MAAGRKSDFTLPTFDDIFSTQEQRDEAKLAKIRDIPISEIDDFPDHPFQVRDDEDMLQLVESVKERGVITPATVRQKDDGRYEIVSGHRRKRACEIARYDTLRCEVVELTRDEATILMVESNFQRSQILPSEKAFAYKMRLEAMNRQGQRTDLTCAPLGDKLAGTKSVMLLAEKSDDSKTQIQRYVRLTNLVPELLEFVDERRIKMRPAVELSYLDEDCQRDIVDEIDLNDATPSHAQTIKMRKFFDEGKLTTEVISLIMAEDKPNQREKIVLRGDKVIIYITIVKCRAKEISINSLSVGCVGYILAHLIPRSLYFAVCPIFLYLTSLNKKIKFLLVCHSKIKQKGLVRYEYKS